VRERDHPKLPDRVQPTADARRAQRAARGARPRWIDRRDAPAPHREWMPVTLVARTGRTNETETERTDPGNTPEVDGARPSVVLLYAAGAPQAQVFPLDLRGGLIIGRDSTALVAPDQLMSRTHAEIRCGRAWSVRDLGSRNGTFVNGVQGTGTVTVAPGDVLRPAKRVFLLTEDGRPFTGSITSGDVVAGPSMRAVLRQIEHAASRGRSLLVTGETGTGKEIAARAFHAASGRV